MVGRERLTEMYHQWEAAKQRLEMAQRTIRGAELEVAKSEARFQGAIEMLAGPGATWTLDADRGIVVGEVAAEPSPMPPEPEVAPNGHGEPVLALRQTDDHGVVTEIKLPRNAAKRKRVMRQLGARGLPSPVTMKGGANG